MAEPTVRPTISESDLLTAAAALAGGPYDRLVTPLEGGGFLVEVAQFAAVVGQGDTIEDAYRAAEQALTAAIAVLLEDGDEVPAPHTAGHSLASKVA